METYARNFRKVQQLRSRYFMDASDEELICPKPRRATHLLYPTPDVFNLPRWSRSNSAAHTDRDAGFEVLDIFLSQIELEDSPPYFCGSPPSRSNNPLIHDAQFVHQRFSSSPSVISQPNSCEPSSHGGNPLVRVEGFTFAGSDSCCSVSAQA